jgi:hypothetical protein
MIIARSVTFGMKAMTKAVLTAGVVFCLSAGAMAQTNISNTRDGNGNLVRRSVPTLHP